MQKALVDLLPGGLEVENPRFATSSGAGPKASLPEHHEFRDDRVVLFCDAPEKPRVFRYALRAVTAGRFRVPPIQASSMYDPGLASLERGAVAEVAAP